MTNTALSTSQTDVNNAINGGGGFSPLGDGDTCIIPAGSSTWTGVSGVGLVANIGNVIIQGAGIGQTIITDGITNTSGVVMSFNTTAGKAFTISGIEFKGQVSKSSQNKGTLNIAGGSHTVRVHDIKFTHPGTGAMIVSGDVWGVIDHCTFLETDPNTGGFVEAIQVQHQNWNSGDGYGDQSWEDSLHLGTNQGMYVEDCSFTGSGVAGGGVIDGTYGARCVFRHNTIVDDLYASHGTETARFRGFRSHEVYDNTFTHTTGSIMFSAIQFRSGNGVVWGNTFNQGASTGYREFLIMQQARVQATGLIGGSYWGFITGTDPWDGNNDASGYPALDQQGRGQCVDHIRGDPALNGGVQAWPHQLLEPTYVWLNTWSAIPGNPPSDPSGIVTQRQGAPGSNPTTTPLVDLGRDVISDAGAHGLTTGLLASRPSTCTQGTDVMGGANTPGQAYWATDTQTLYVCFTNNVWTQYYQPFTYPHPLVTGGVTTGGGGKKIIRRRR